MTFLVEKRLERALENNEEEKEASDSDEFEDVNEEDNKNELKELMDNDLDTDEGDLDWDEYSLEDTGAIDFNLGANDPNTTDEVTMLRNSLEKMYNCQNVVYTQLVNQVGVS